MPATPWNQITDLNGVTHVAVVSAPAAGVKRIVLSVRVYNRDAVDQTPTLVSDVSATEREIEKRTALVPGAVWKPINRDDPYVLDAVTKSLEMFMAGAVNTTNPVCHANGIDIS